MSDGRSSYHIRTLKLHISVAGTTVLGYPIF